MEKAAEVSIAKSNRTTLQGKVCATFWGCIDPRWSPAACRITLEL